MLCPIRCFLCFSNLRRVVLFQLDLRLPVEAVRSGSWHLANRRMCCTLTRGSQCIAWHTSMLSTGNRWKCIHEQRLYEVAVDEESVWSCHKPWGQVRRSERRLAAKHRWCDAYSGLQVVRRLYDCSRLEGLKMSQDSFEFWNHQLNQLRVA